MRAGAISPLIAGEDYPPYRNGLRRTCIKGIAVKRKLATTYQL